EGDQVLENSVLKNPEKSLDTENLTKNSSDYMVAFSGLAKSYCVGIVDMVDSTKISSDMNEVSWGKYYEIFLNSMAKVLPRFGGVVIKNQGDSLLYYFPESSKSTKFGFMSCIECSLALIDQHDVICEKSKQEGLPCLNYRVSADYGRVVSMKANNSSSLDLIGPPVNMCAKINHTAAPNGTVIGGDLHSMVKGFDDYRFKELKGFSLGLKQSYPVYSIVRR
ncbi:MAG TPA: adenylate/guanylate cyclase domain-containing protein, partial [Nitrosopumilaceae archaeon]|nr:adenylate/guanylate cyclase domain-containing protein [Nitrosopumilaceae archaeon]